MIENAKPCPFCGLRNLSFESHHRYFVVCDDCRCEGPGMEETESEALRRWNERAAIPPSLEDDESQTSLRSLRGIEPDRLKGEHPAGFVKRLRDEW